MKTNIVVRRSILPFIWLIVFGCGRSEVQSSDDQYLLRTSPVSFHLSFDDGDLYDQDHIVFATDPRDTARVMFPEAVFGRGMVRRIYRPEGVLPDPHNLAGMHHGLTTAVFGGRPGNHKSYSQPFVWGGARLNPRLGAVAFWAKGQPPYAGPLFEQGSAAFGRMERDLIEVGIDEQGRLWAYLRDARYQRHEIHSESVWDPLSWNHIVLNWDWANGLELWMNGTVVATSWGDDGWFETTPPGLFHLPAAGVTYDEFYLFDRPLSDDEINDLITTNTPPTDESPVYIRTQKDYDRIAEMSGASVMNHLPVATPGTHLHFEEVWPDEVVDGHIPLWSLLDGRNEMGVPHPYSMFTIVLGDVDFHAERADIQMPPSSRANYVTLSGNLNNVRLLDRGGAEEDDGMPTLVSVPQGPHFFYGSMFDERVGGSFRIPFAERYGTPANWKGNARGIEEFPYFVSEYGVPNDFGGDLRLAIGGEKRIHSLGFYNVTVMNPNDPELSDQRLTIWRPSEVKVDSRMLYALHAVTSRDERSVAMASLTYGEQVPDLVEIGALHRLNLLTEPFRENIGISAVTLTLPVKTALKEEVLFIRVRNPALPLRIWNQIALTLTDFDADFGLLEVTIDFTDMVLAEGDRLWIDLGTAGEAQILLGSPGQPASMAITPVDAGHALDAYSEKQIVASKAEYNKGYESRFWPWYNAGRTVTLEKPDNMGGAFDVIMPALAVQRVNPNHPVANYLVKMAGEHSHVYWDGHRRQPESVSRIILDNPYRAPEWALYWRAYNQKRWDVANWWRDHQNPDGQLGGGWNDDTLILRRMQDLPLDGHVKARDLVDAIHTGLEATQIYKDGFANVTPMDRLHIADFISERYTTILNNLGQAYAMEREMESAWRLDRPKETPINYAQGIAFTNSVNMIKWYWGEHPEIEPHQVQSSIAELADELHLFASLFDEDYLYRMTAARVHTDAIAPAGSLEMYRYLLGGSWPGGRDIQLRLAVSWPSVGGPDVPRIVLHADDKSLKTAIYSFHSTLQEITMRLLRIEDGRYRIVLLSDPDSTGEGEEELWVSERDITRFDTLSIPVPPRTPIILQIEQLQKVERPDRLADLAIDPWGATMENGNVTATIHNLGNADAARVRVQLLVGGEPHSERVIPLLPAPTDFVAKRTDVNFENVPHGQEMIILIDPYDEIREIFRENNRARVLPAGQVSRRAFGE